MATGAAPVAPDANLKNNGRPANGAQRGVLGAGLDGEEFDPLPSREHGALPSLDGRAHAEQPPVVPIDMGQAPGGWPPAAPPAS